MSRDERLAKALSPSIRRLHAGIEREMLLPKYKDKPSVELAAALAAMGLAGHEQTRGGLRSLIHASTGVPPDLHLPTDQLARRVLELHSTFKLKRSQPST